MSRHPPPPSPHSPHSPHSPPSHLSHLSPLPAQPRRPESDHAAEAGEPHRAGPRLQRACALGFGLLAATFLATAALMGPRAPAQDQAPVAFAAAAVDQPPGASPGTTRSRFDPRRFVLNALLAPALDPDVDPPAWTDPRPVMACDTASSIRIDGLALAPGSRVPSGRFILDWDAHQCRPFGLEGPRVDGSARLVIDHVGDVWTAMVLPAGMAFTLADGHSLPLMAGRVRMPATTPADRLLASLDGPTRTGGPASPASSASTLPSVTQP